MTVTERFKTLIDTSNDILTIYHENMGNRQITLQLKSLMADNIILLQNMINDASNLSLFPQDDPDIMKLNEDLFIVFNECVNKNIKIVNFLSETSEAVV